MRPLGWFLVALAAANATLGIHMITTDASTVDIAINFLVALACAVSAVIHESEVFDR